jgi:hypothetical protein
MPQCEHIMLGGSHDNGYARILSNLETTNIMPGKVVLLQGPSPAPELERFDTFLFPRIKFRELFMQRKLECGKRYAQVAAETSSPTRNISMSPPMLSSATPQRLAEPELGDFSS